MKIVEIYWIDSAHTEGWQKFDDFDFENNSELFIRTIGYLVHEDDMKISVVQSLTESIFDKGKGDADAIMQIPKCSIKKRIIISKNA